MIYYKCMSELFIFSEEGPEGNMNNKQVYFQ